MNERQKYNIRINCDKVLKKMNDIWRMDIKCYEPEGIYKSLYLYPFKLKDQTALS